MRLGDLLPNPKNWRLHPENQRAAMKALLSEVGFAGTPLAYQGEGGLTLLDGHLRAELDPDALVHVAITDLDQAEADEVLATYDPIATMAERDQETLDALIRQVTTEDEAIQGLLASLSGDRWMQTSDDQDVANATEALDAAESDDYEPFSKRGQVWALGEHRLVCGDATNETDVNSLLSGVRPGLCVTDPPYGVDYDPGWRNEAAAAGHLAYADRRIGQVTNDNRSDWGDAWRLFPGDVIYSWHPAGATSLVHAHALQTSGFALRMQIIWAKSNFPIGRGDYHVRHEPCWYAVRQGKPARRTKDRTQTTLWEINLDRNVEGGHPTQKPVECMERPIRNHEFTDVYDPFVGSGTTLIAAEKLGRRCYAMEIEPRYVDVTIRRWEAFTGGKAELLVDSV